MRIGKFVPVVLLLLSPAWLKAQQVQMQQVQAGPATPAPQASAGFICTPFSNFDGNNRCDPVFWVSGDYLLWWVKGPSMPPLVTTGPFNPNNPGSSVPAALGSPGTQILYGGSNLELGALSGMRFGLGGWLDTNRIIGFDVNGFVFPQTTRTFSAVSNSAGQPFLGVPFFDTNAGVQAVAAVAHPNDAANIRGGLVGGIVSNYSMDLWGAEGNFDVKLLQTRSWRLDMLAGFRFLNLNESLGLQQTYSPIGQPVHDAFLGNTVGLGQSVVVNDGFSTSNQFYGGQLGARFNYQMGRLNLEFLGKVALGDTVQHVGINGQTTLYVPGQSPVYAGSGMLAAPSNIGSYQHNAFTVVPEVGVNLAYDLTSHLRLRMGYSFLYWSSVVRPGDQIDTNVNPRQTPSLGSYTPGFVGQSPAAQFNTNSFWAQGLNFGLELRF